MKEKIDWKKELLESGKFNDKFSVLVSPVFFHENLVTFADQQNSQFGAVVGARFMLTKRTSINFDYGYHLNKSKTSFKEYILISKLCVFIYIKEVYCIF